MNHPSFTAIIVVIYAGFNALLLTVIGLLMTFSRPTADPAGWRMACGFVLLTVGVLIGAAICGVLARREWGRKIVSAGLLFCIPLNGIAIFPILQNHRMTVGNTLLQIACMAASSASILYLTRKPIFQLSPAAPSSEDSNDARERSQDRFGDGEERPFTFDRRDHSKE